MTENAPRPSLPKGTRRLMIFTAPHVADPSWTIPVVEMEDQGQSTKPVEYYNTDVLESIVRNLVHDRARAEGYNAGAQFVLQTFGLTTKAFYEKVEENKKKKEKQ